MTKKKSQPEVPFSTLFGEFAEGDSPIRAALIKQLSDINSENLQLVTAQWDSVPVTRRRVLLSRIAETSESDFEVDFTDLALFALQDADPEIRQHAVASLWYSEDPQIMRRFITLLRDDEEENVRAAAAEALGKFVLAGELGDVPEAVGQEAVEVLLHILDSPNEPITVYRRALESLSYSGHDELPILIRQAYDHDDLTMRASAIFAMGRSADERWTRYVLRGLDEPEAEIRYEAARAAGELEITGAVSKLSQMAYDADREIREAAIWALGEIGGAEAQQILFRMTEAEADEDLLEAIEDALNTAQLSAGQFGAIILPDADEDDFTDIDDLEDDED